MPMNKTIVRDLLKKAQEDIDGVMERTLVLVPDAHDDIEDATVGCIAIVGGVTGMLLQEFVYLAGAVSLKKDPSTLSNTVYTALVEHHLAELGKILIAGHASQLAKAQKAK